MRRLGNQSAFRPLRCVSGNQLFFLLLSRVATPLTSNSIILAAHCEHDGQSGNPVVVKLGVIYIHDNGSHAQIISIAAFTSHPQYRSSEKYYDIALVKLKSSIRFDEHVRPACVGTESERWTKMIAIGFGKIQYGQYPDEK